MTGSQYWSGKLALAWLKVRICHVGVNFVIWGLPLPQLSFSLHPVSQEKHISTSPSLCQSRPPESSCFLEWLLCKAMSWHVSAIFQIWIHPRQTIQYFNCVVILASTLLISGAPTCLAKANAFSPSLKFFILKMLMQHF